MNKEGLLSLGLIVVFILMAFILVIVSIQKTQLKKELAYLNAVESQCESCVLCTDEPKYGVGGAYYEGRAYCIWVKGNTPEEIYASEVHEQCHDLIYHDYEHFCHNSSDKN